MMRIESIAEKPDRAGKFLVRFDNGTAMRLYRQTVEQYGLYPGYEMDAEALQRLRSDAGAMSAKMRAVRIVAASSVSRDDLRQRLVRKGEDPVQAEEAVSWMEEMKLVDDRQTAAQIVSRCISKGYGISRAKQALYEKRIPKQYWDEALAGYPDQTEVLVEFLRARLGNNPDEKTRKRAIDALLRRGHSYGDIRSALMQLDYDEFPEDYDG